MKNKFEALILIYKTNSKLLLNSFERVTEKDSLKRTNNKTNSMLFIALHLLDARYFILNQIGYTEKNPFGKYVDWVKTIEEVKNYPKLKKFLNEWKQIDTIFVDKLSKLTPKKWNSEMEYKFPDGKKIIHMISFLAEHEAYHVGQIAFIRKYLGYPPTSYE